jgi:flagellar basal-body rod modification protein FlgD
MTSPISGSSSAADAIVAASSSKASGTSETSKSKNDMDKDLFLKLLVAQMKYQDPSKPADTSQFLAQTAQFTMVEKLEELSKNQTELLTAQLMTSATSMIGRTVTYTGLDGKEASGVVTSTTIGSNPTLKVGNTDVALSSVKEVKNPPAAAGSPAK